MPVQGRVELPSSLLQEDEHSDWRILRATVTGETKAFIDDQTVIIRIARAGYCGMLKYRYLEEGED